MIHSPAVQIDMFPYLTGSFSHPMLVPHVFKDRLLSISCWISHIQLKINLLIPLIFTHSLEEDTLAVYVSMA